MPTSGVTHDITITSGVVTRGYMWYRDKDGRRHPSIEDAESLRPAAIDTAAAIRASANLGEFSFAYRQYWVQNDWRGGMGGALARLDPLRHGGSRNIDVSSDGRLQVARKLTKTSVNTAPAWNEPTGFAVVGSTSNFVFFRHVPYLWDRSLKQWIRFSATGIADTILIRNGVQFGGRTFVPAWSSKTIGTTGTYPGARYHYKSEGDAIWQPVGGQGVGSADTNAPKYFAVAGGLLWGGFWFEGSKHHVRSNPDGTQLATWSSLTTVGDSSAEITNLIGDQDTLLICKQDGIWALLKGETNARNLIPEYQQMRHPHHFRAGVAWNSHVLVSLGAGGMLDIWNGQVYDVSFKYSLPGATHLHGRVIAMAADPERVFCMVHDPDTATQDKLHILGGYWAGFGDALPSWRWQHLAEIRIANAPGSDVLQTATLFTAATAEVIVVGDVPVSFRHRRLWVGTGQIPLLTDKAVRPFFIPLDGDDEVEYNETDADPADHVGNSLYESVVFDANTPNIPKLWLSVELKTKNVAAARSVQVQYRLDAPVDSAAVYTNLGDPQATDNPTILFPSGISSKTLQVALLLSQTAASRSSTEDIIDITVSYYLRPGRLETIPLRLYIAEGQVLLNGGRNSRARSDLSQLRTWTGQAAEVTVVDTEGNTQTAVLVPGTLKVRELVKEPGRHPEYLVEVLLAEI